MGASTASAVSTATVQRNRAAFTAASLGAHGLLPAFQDFEALLPVERGEQLVADRDGPGGVAELLLHLAGRGLALDVVADPIEIAVGDHLLPALRQQIIEEELAR